jgi:hypothetical protein
MRAASALAIAALAAGACTVPDRPYRSTTDSGAPNPPDAAIDGGVSTLVLSDGPIMLDEGATHVYHVALTGPAPTHNITVELASDAPDLFRAEQPHVVFTAADYQDPHALSLVAYQDADAVDDAAHLTFTSDDLAEERVQVVIKDDDVQAILASPSSLLMPEGSAQAIGLRLAARPIGPVTVSVAAVEPNEVLPTQYTFDASNWDQGRMMTVLSHKDANTIDEVTVIMLSSPGLPSAAISVRNIDSGP